MTQQSILLDGLPVPFEEGQTIMDAAMAAEIFIPHLCHHPEFKPQGSCKLCTVKASGRYVSACTMPARDGMEVENNSPDLNDKRRTMLQMLFVEGNHFCPSCEKSGNCDAAGAGLRSTRCCRRISITSTPSRPVDASHPHVLLDFNRCISLRAVRARQPRRGRQVTCSRSPDVGSTKHLVVNAESGRLADTDFSADRSRRRTSARSG
jgi:[NiFe] hydrogenase diaphorase moiety small subunit